MGCIKSLNVLILKNENIFSQTLIDSFDSLDRIFTSSICKPSISLNIEVSSVVFVIVTFFFYSIS